MLRPLGPAHTARILQLTADAERELAEDFDHRVELARWIGTDGADGVPAAALGARPDRHPAPVRDLGRAAPATALPAASYEPRPQLAVLATAQDEPADWLRAGQALQRVLLSATVAGLAVSFLYQPIELHDMRQARPCWWPCRRARRSSSGSVTGRRAPVRRGAALDDILDSAAGGAGTSAWLRR